MIASAQQLSDLMFLAEGEGPGRFYFFVAVMIFFAIRRLMESAKAKAAARHDRTHIDVEENDDWYDEEMERVGYHDPNPNTDRLQEFFRTVNQPNEVPPPPPVIPPAVPRPRRPPAEKKTPLTGLSREEKLVLDALKNGKDLNLTHGRSHRDRVHSSAQHSELGKMLRHPSHLRNAFILKEILDPPLAAREDPAPHKI